MEPGMNVDQPATIQREAPEVDEKRKALVNSIIEDVKADLRHWEPEFTRMREMRKFARGLQWPGMTRKDLYNSEAPYVENITQRAIKQAVAQVYARNPTHVWRKSKRMHGKRWDGSPEAVQEALMVLSDPAALPQGRVVAEQIVQESVAAAQHEFQIKRLGETVQIVYEHQLREQQPSFKSQMKRMVTQARICGVAYVRLGYQTITQYPPDVERQIADARSQIEKAKQIADDLVTGEIQQESGEVERLRLLLAQLEGAQQVMLREGLTVNFPDPTNVIPDRGMTAILGFLGCKRVTERFHMTRDEVKRTYKVDLGQSYTGYSRVRAGSDGIIPAYSAREGTPDQDDRVCVFEVRDREDGLLYTVADGYHDFLVEPAPPQPWLERFWDIFAYHPNALDDPEHPWPPGDVELMMAMQMEINRAGQAKRDHRYAARPGHVTPGSMDPDDARAVSTRAAHDVVPLKGLNPEQDVRAYLQAFPTSPIDPNLYETGSLYTSILRTTGRMQAEMGPTTSASATEAGIAATARGTSDDSETDELDDLLSEMARSGAQILLNNMTPQTAAEIAGPGAVWPMPDQKALAREVFLEVEAGSSGRKNQQIEVQTRQAVFPLMMQIPEADPRRMLRDLVTIMDPKANFEDWLRPMAPSITAMNGVMQGQANRGDDPNAQGPEGESNAPQPDGADTPGPQQKEPPAIG
jgi:hypothetical protein